MDAVTPADRKFIMLLEKLRVIWYLGYVLNVLPVLKTCQATGEDRNQDIVRGK
jgi:hypothetical protein